MFDLTDNVAIVTGGSKGLGKAISKVMAKQGCFVVIVNRNAEDGRKALEEIIAEGGAGMTFACDVSDKNACVEVVEKTFAAKGKIDILVNNAGITKDNLFLRMSDDQWDSVMKVNLDSVFYMTGAVSKLMLKKRYGRIINISSVVGFTGNPGQVNYSATKSALVGFSKSLAKEIGSRNITCNIVAPGFIESDMTDSLNESQKESIIKNIPTGKIGSPDDIAHAVLYLASSEAAYVNGSVLHVNGGMY